MTHITFLGLGAMGSRMAANLLKNGHALTVWNRTPLPTKSLVSAGARVATTPRSAVEDAGIVISMVRDDAASREVWLDRERGALSGMKSGSIAIESSTLSVQWVQELAHACAARGTAFLDAPVLGSRPQATEAQLIYLVGGAHEVVERARQVLQAMGSAIHATGPVGSGAAMKLAANALFGIQVAAIAEVLGLLDHQGLDPSHAAELLGATPLLSPAAKGAAAGMLSGNFSPLFPIELVEKDLAYAGEEAARCASNVPLINATRRVFVESLRRDMGADNITGVARLYRTN